MAPYGIFYRGSLLTMPPPLLSYVGDAFDPWSFVHCTMRDGSLNMLAILFNFFVVLAILIKAIDYLNLDTSTNPLLQKNKTNFVGAISDLSNNPEIIENYSCLKTLSDCMEIQPFLCFLGRVLSDFQRRYECNST